MVVTEPPWMVTVEPTNHGCLPCRKQYREYRRYVYEPGMRQKPADAVAVGLTNEVNIVRLVDVEFYDAARGIGAYDVALYVDIN
jgi:hypothetical protein